MSWWSRVRNVFTDSVTDDIDEELRLHLEDAIANGRDPAEARRALGSVLRLREESRDARVIRWLDALWSDARFAVRRLLARPVTSAAAVVSLALGIGSTLAAFRIADALLWRPLPISHPERLHVLSLTGITPDGTLARSYTWVYPQFARMRDEVKDDARLLAASVTSPLQLAYAPANEPERTTVQYVSADIFDAFGLQPALGRVLTIDDDRAPGASPSAVLSNAYWRSRFGADPSVLGRELHIGDVPLHIVGVVSGPFIGTEPGVRVDVFLPASMHQYFTKDDAQWFRTLAIVRPGADSMSGLTSIRERARAVWRGYETERAKGFTSMPQQVIDQMLSLQFELTAEPNGSSPFSVSLATPLTALGIIVALVMLVACGNVANLAVAQAAAREREMALRASIGAGRGRLVQMIGVECAVVAIVSTWLGAAFAAWAAPFVVSHANPPNVPIYLRMAFDWRLAGAAAAMALIVGVLFGIWPAIRASLVDPVSVVRGFSSRFTRRPVARILIAAQVAFCVLVVFVGGMLITTFERLSSRALGFSADDVVTMSVSATGPQPIERWKALRDAIATQPGVQQAAIARWPMLEGNSWNGFVSVDGAAPGPVLGQFLDVSPEFLDLMLMPLLAGRRLTAADRAPGPAIVNETFVRTYLNGVPPEAALSRHFAKSFNQYEIVGVMRDALYSDVHSVVPPLAFVPIASTLADGSPRRVSSMTMVVRGKIDRTDWREAIRSAAPGFSVVSIRTQRSIVDAQTVRERLLAMLGAFFCVVSLVLAGVGLYGMLHYSVLHRRREIGIRRAVGASGIRIVRVLTREFAITIACGLVVGLGSGVLVARALHSLFYDTRPNDPAALAIPIALVLGSSILAAAVPVIRATRISPLTALRDE